MRMVRVLLGCAIAGGMAAMAAPAWAPTQVEYNTSLLLPAISQGRPIEVVSFQWGIGRGSMPLPDTGKPPQGAHELIIVVRNADWSGPGDFNGPSGRRLGNAVLVVHRPGERPVEYDLTGVTAYSQSSGGDRPTESITLNFTGIQMKARSEEGDGSVRPNASGNPWTAP